MNLTGKVLPVHSLGLDEAPVQVKHIEYKNPYDFTREHRHTYFEVFFFEKGGGSQLIDFIDLPVKEQSCYIVFPQQIHLLKRSPRSAGRLVQFGEEVITSLPLRLMMQQHFFNEMPAVFFEKDKKRFAKLTVLLNLLEEAALANTHVLREISVHYLQALLLQLLDGKVQENNSPVTGERKVLFDFQQQLELQFRDNHQVSKYAASLNTTEKKLGDITRKYLGLTPLQVIHNRMLLEAKRMLLFEEIAHKEIAFQLGFDSPASFSLFIKNKTGFTPSELNIQLVKIHK
ncbi:MAG: helix-turn-helix domain-containing protein [Bacteroidota bacterium]|nr:helix-turn-helix domain-containing protein [Bacteroidota bacterium]